MPTLTQREYRRLKSRLTRCQNRLKKAASDTARLEAALALVKEVDYAMEIFHEQGYPDFWNNWERAKDDVQFLIHREGRIRG